MDKSLCAVVGEDGRVVERGGMLGSTLAQELSGAVVACTLCTLCVCVLALGLFRFAGGDGRADGGDAGDVLSLRSVRRGEYDACGGGVRRVLSARGVRRGENDDVCDACDGRVLSVWHREYDACGGGVRCEGCSARNAECEGAEDGEEGVAHGGLRAEGARERARGCERGAAVEVGLGESEGEDAGLAADVCAGCGGAEGWEDDFVECGVVECGAEGFGDEGEAGEAVEAVEDEPCAFGVEEYVDDACDAGWRRGQCLRHAVGALLW